MPRLRRSDVSRPGLTRMRRGQGFDYLDAAGGRIADPDVLDRVVSLVIPPAWEDVWISPHANGHIQAIGTDQRGRRQYRYHDRWQAQQAEAKFDRVLEFARGLPAVRARVGEDLSRTELDRSRVLACAVRLLDIGFFRVGGEEYAETNQTYGLATLRREHASIDGDTITFDYIAKSGKHRVQAVADPEVRDVLAALLAREDDNPELLAFLGADSQWVDVRSGDINSYLREVSGTDISAKDFRTWSATVLCAVALAVSEPVSGSPTGRKRALSRALQETSAYLGNTPAVCRSSYVDPRIVDLFNGGITISEDLDRLGEDAVVGELSTQGAIETAVLELIESPQAERSARAHLRRETRQLEAARERKEASAARRTSRRSAARSSAAA